MIKERKDEQTRIPLVISLLRYETEEFVWTIEITYFQSYCFKYGDARDRKKVYIQISCMIRSPKFWVENLEKVCVLYTNNYSI